MTGDLVCYFPMGHFLEWKSHLTHGHRGEQVPTIVSEGRSSRSSMPNGSDSGQLAATVLSTMPVAVTRCSADLRYLWVSERYAAWLGLPAAEIAGKPIVDVIGEDGMVAIRPYVETVLAGKRVEYEDKVTFNKI